MFFDGQLYYWQITVLLAHGTSKSDLSEMVLHVHVRRALLTSARSARPILCRVVLDQQSVLFERRLLSFQVF